MKYRMTIFPALEKGNKRVKFGYKTSEQTETARNTAAGLPLFVQDEIKAMPDCSNIFVLEEQVNGEWEECEELYS